MNNKFAGIPEELRLLKFWIMWKDAKVPYTIRGTLANVTDADDWSTFNEVFNTYSLGGYSGIGFVFDNSHPYSFIDLDNTKGDKAALERQLKVSAEFDSYSEVSPSGMGLHIIVKGKIPQGRRRSFIEIYSHNRYATMTGNVYNPKPIADRNELLNQLFNQMGGPPSTVTYTGDEAEEFTDEEIIKQASDAINGEKFTKLYSGNWQELYGSQSEADFATIDIIAFYTQNRNQIARIFRNSALGKRAKSNRKDYLESMVLKSFDKLALKTDFDGFRIQLENKIAEASQSWDNLDGTTQSNNRINGNNTSSIYSTESGSVAQRLEPIPHKNLVAGSNPAASTTLIPPPGLVGDIARFIYEAAPRPVPEIAIAGAMGLMAGICGRAYNISGTGLNQYILCLAMTGAGKEAMASGIDKIINAVQMQVPVAGEFVGPAEIASGQALIKYLANSSQSFISILGEFGLRLRAMSSDRANGAEIALRRMLLDLYNKSGYGQVARPSIYSDKDKNTLAISSPAFSILGESTPERFYEILNEEMISEGLLPRFMLIEYHGERPKLNEGAINAQPSISLIERVAQLMVNAKTVMANRKVINVATNPDAEEMLKDFDKLADSKINSTDKEIIRQLWNRAHIKTLKIAALIACGIDIFNPLITVEYVLWAKQIVEHDIYNLSAKFVSGEIGKSSEEIKQLKEIKRMIKIFVTKDYSEIKSYCKDQRLFEAKIIPFTYLSKRVGGLSAFQKDRLGANNALKRAIQILIDSDYIREPSKKEMIEKFSTTQKAYIVTSMAILNEDD